MKKIILIVILFISIFSVHAQTQNIPYEFPFKPGTEEWKQFKSGNEMVQACKIPDSILISLSTEALAKTCLSYPLLNEVFYANNLQTGIKGVIKNFNGLSELLKRKHAGQEIFKIYKDKNVKDLKENINEVQKAFLHLNLPI